MPAFGGEGVSITRLRNQKSDELRFTECGMPNGKFSVYNFKIRKQLVKCSLVTCIPECDYK